MYAIIETGGKQLKVEKGDAIFVEKLEGEAGDKVIIDKVVMISDNGTKIGTP
ncbi:MAG: 50S ribosomal protein L21, partial [Solobacterium sp.]|nr:50S ribosomal protein L21 [Solobacterium sp.]